MCMQLSPSGAADCEGGGSQTWVIPASAREPTLF